MLNPSVLVIVLSFLYFYTRRKVISGQANTSASILATIGQMKQFILLCCFLISLPYCNSQQDTSSLQLNVLTIEDIDQVKPLQEKQTIFTGLRTEANLEDLPITVYVVTKEEIALNGYQTLTEVLRTLPGIRVSLSGNALDGENFMLRGHYGNTYAKILINDIPIRPSVVGAMPLASQLPIRQAERIEVIYGPSATLYGSDAAAGIINIILKENKFPTYASANIEAGNENLARLNVAFGGKYKFNEEELDISLFGGFTTFNDRRIKYDIDNLYNIENYSSLIGLNNFDEINFQDRPNFSANERLPLNKLSHQSNYIGFSAKLGAFSFLTQRFFRSDHSTLGINPLAVSYSDPQQTFGEEIISTSANYEKEYNDWKWRLTLNSTIYNINQNSSFSYILPAFGLVSNAYGTGLIGEPTLDQNTNIASSIDSIYFTGPRFSSGNFNDFSLEYKAFIQLTSSLNLSAGVGLEGGVGEGINRFLLEPEETATIFDIPRVIENPRASFATYLAFAEFYYNKGPLTLLAGSQVYRRADRLEQNSVELSPRIGLLYKINSSMSLRAFYSEAFRYPSAFYSNSSFTASSQNGDLLIESGSLGLEPETTNNIELGLRLALNPKIHIDATLFQTRTQNFINYEIRPTDDQSSVFFGFANSNESFTQLRGLQLRLTMKDFLPTINFDTDISLSYTRGNERILSLLFEETGERSLIDLSDVRAQPDFILYMNNRLKITKDLSIILQHSILSESLSRNKFRVTNALSENNLSSVANDAYYTIDFRAVFQFNRQLNCYFNIFNATNIEYAGIDGTEDFDSLLFNPQSTRYISFGVNFSFN